MKIACLLMQKNERDMLEIWLKHHSEAFGIQNLYVFDNGSTDQNTLSILSRYEEQGLNVYRQFKTSSDFTRKGEIISAKIKELDASENPYDFYFPLDTDELLAVEVSGRVSLDKSEILKELDGYVGDQRVLLIAHSYDVNPIKADEYYKNPNQRKCFFYNGTCAYLDLGFHHGKTNSGDEWVKTNIVYIHHHHKQYFAHIFNSVQKLMNRVPSLGEADLTKHLEKRGAGFHLIPDMLISRDEYYNRFTGNPNLFDVPVVRETLSEEGLYDKLKGLMNFDYASPSASDSGSTGEMRGYIDNIKFADGKIVVRGWAASPQGRYANKLRMAAGVWTFDAVPSARYPRPDIQNVVPGADLFSGFEATFPAPPFHFGNDAITIRPVHKNGEAGRALATVAKLGSFTRNSLEKTAEASIRPLRQLLDRHLPELKIRDVFNIGADVGQSVDSLRDVFPDAIIHCFEGTPTAFRTLSEKFGSAASVRLNKVSIGTSSVDQERQPLSAILQNASSGRVGYLKIDAVGRDIDILQSSTDCLANVDLIECQLSPNSYNKLHSAFCEVTSFLDEHGFYIFQLFEPFMEWQDGGRPVLRRVNAVFVNKTLSRIAQQHRIGNWRWRHITRPTKVDVPGLRWDVDRSNPNQKCSMGSKRKMAKSDLNDEKMRLADAESLLSEAKIFISRGDLNGAKALFAESVPKFDDLIDQFGHPLFRKEFLRALVDHGHWSDAKDFVPKPGSAGGDSWHENLFARSYAKHGDHEKANFWWRKVTARLPRDREARSWLNRHLKLKEPFSDFYDRVGDVDIRTIFDVGANEGQSCREYASIFPNATIHAFEPVPTTFEVLTRNTQSLAGITCHNVAFGKKDGTIPMSAQGTSTMNRVVEGGAKSGTIDVKAMRIESFCKENGIDHIDFLKVDTEGYDLNVVKGCGKFIENIDFIQCETSANDYNQFHNSYFDIYKYLTKSGFYLFKIYGQTFEWGGGGYPVLRRMDAVFINGRVVGEMKNVVTK